jgi:hypothetical protein
VTLSQAGGLIGIIVGVIQCAALIFYAGEMRATVRDHDRRISLLETSDRGTNRDIGFLKAKEGASA